MVNPLIERSFEGICLLWCAPLPVEVPCAQSSCASLASVEVSSHSALYIIAASHVYTKMIKNKKIFSTKYIIYIWESNVAALKCNNLNDIWITIKKHSFKWIIGTLYASLFLDSYNSSTYVIFNFNINSKQTEKVFTHPRQRPPHHLI